MKLLIITDTFPPEKVGSYRMHDLSKRLSKQGFDIHVLIPPPTFPFGCFKRNWRFLEKRLFNGFKVTQLWTWQPNSSQSSIFSRILYYLIMPIFAVCWLIFKRDFKIVLTSSGTSPFLFMPGLVLKTIFKKKWVIDLRDLLVDGAVDLGFMGSNSRITAFFRFFEKTCFMKCDFIIVTSDGAIEGLRKYSIPQNKILLIPNGTETEIFHSINVKKKRQIIYAGNIGFAQDFNCVVEAMLHLSKSDVTLLVVGEGDAKNQLKTLVKKMGLQKSIIILDGVDREKLPPLLSSSLVGIAPIKKTGSIKESIPAKIFDYMACEIPYVAFGGSCLQNISQKSKAGFVLDNDSKCFAKIIMALIDDEKLRTQMGKNGRKFCEQNYSRIIMTRKMKELFESIDRTSF